MLFTYQFIGDCRYTKERLSVEKMTPDTLALIFTAIKESEAGTYTCSAIYANSERLYKSVRIDTICEYLKEKVEASIAWTGSGPQKACSLTKVQQSLYVYWFL